jgi:hypothetical protein
MGDSIGIVIAKEIMLSAGIPLQMTSTIMVKLKKKKQVL